MGHGDGAVTVAAGLHHREKLRSLRQVAEDAVAVGADRTQVDLGPTEGAAEARKDLRR